MAFILALSLPDRNVYTALAADTKDVATASPTDICYETDTGDLYEFNGAAWRKIGTTTSSGEAAGLRVKGSGSNLKDLDGSLPFGTGVTVTAALTKIAEFAPGGEAFSIQFDVITQNLDQFVIYGKFGSGGSYQVLYSSATDYTVPTGALIMSSGDLTTIAATETGVFQMLSRGLYSVKLEAAAAITGAIVTVHGAAQ